MQTKSYYGKYVTFDTVSKRDAAVLLGADTLVGDFFTIVFKTEQDATTAWLENKFGALVGYFDSETSSILEDLKQSGWTMRILLSFVAFTDTPKPGHYWGQVALICYDPSLDQAFAPFVERVSALLIEGIHPQLDLDEQEIDLISLGNSTKRPYKTVPLPKKEQGTVLVKSRRSVKEKCIEQARRGNKGCYFVSWVFLLALVAAILFCLKFCGVF